MNIKFLDHYALGVIFAPSVCVCHLTLVNNKTYFVLKFMDPSRRAITKEEKYCVKLLAATGLWFSSLSPACPLGDECTNTLVSYCSLHWPISAANPFATITQSLNYSQSLP